MSTKDELKRLSNKLNRNPDRATMEKIFNRLCAMKEEFNGYRFTAACKGIDATTQNIGSLSDLELSARLTDIIEDAIAVYYQ